MRMLIRARNCSLAIEGDRIVDEGGRYDVVIECREADVRPGLINAHDHLHRNHYGRLGRGPYPNAYRWAEDIQQRFRRQIARARALPRRAALLHGAWKNLFAGVSTVVHHDAWEPDFERDFPIRVPNIASADSLGMTKCIEVPATGPFFLHVAEGTDARATGELAELDRRGMLNERLVVVHGVAVRNGDAARFGRSGAALTWCPTSNRFLFGRTVSAELLDTGCDLLLGSDSRLTGEGDLLDELRAARDAKLVEEERLGDAVGRTAAGRLEIAEPSLDPGSRADVILLARPLLEARSADVLLNVVGGIPRVASVQIAGQLGSMVDQGVAHRVGGVRRWTYQQGRLN